MKFEEFKAEEKPKKNYYEVLGVSPSATAAEIKNAFRKLAKETHPDLAGEAKKEEFIEAEQAYTILSDEAKRAEYDRNNSIKEERDKKDESKDENGGESDEYWEEFKKEALKDKELLMMLMLSKSRPDMKETVDEIFRSSYELFKKRKESEREMGELHKRKEELNRMEEELNRRTNFRTSSFNSKSRERNNTRNIDGDLGVEKDILGNEKLVDLRTGRQIGYGSYKKVEFISGVIIATDIIGNRRVLNRKGESSFESFRDIQVRDGLVIGKDIIGNEKLIDKHTGKTISRGMYKKIIREGGKIYGVNILGRKEEIY